MKHLLQDFDLLTKLQDLIFLTEPHLCLLARKPLVVAGTVTLLNPKRILKSQVVFCSHWDQPANNINFFPFPCHFFQVKQKCFLPAVSVTATAGNAEALGGFGSGNIPRGIPTSCGCFPGAPRGEKERTNVPGCGFAQFPLQPCLDLQIPDPLSGFSSSQLPRLKFWLITPKAAPGFLPKL